MSPFNPIATDRLTIKALAPIDAEDLFAYRRLPEVCAFQPWNPTDLSQVEFFIHDNLNTSINTQNTWLQLGVYLKDGRLIGDLGLHFLEDNAQMEIGYTLSPTYQGQGYAFEAVTGLIEYLFLTLKKHRISASVDPENQRSIHLLQKLGFRQEAHFKKSLLIHGKWCDDIIYALLEEEWKSQR